MTECQPNLFGEPAAGEAVFSPCETLRYTLHRWWGEGPRVAFLMFNPSTATAVENDHTITKTIGFAEKWGYGSLVVLNLFAIRGTDPKTPGRTVDPVGPDNDRHILAELANCDLLVCAWGCSAHLRGKLTRRPGEVLALIAVTYPNLRVECLGYSKDGSPRHPLMLSYRTPLEKFEVKAA